MQVPSISVQGFFFFFAPDIMWLPLPQGVFYLKKACDWYRDMLITDFFIGGWENEGNTGCSIAAVNAETFVAVAEQFVTV